MSKLSAASLIGLQFLANTACWAGPSGVDAGAARSNLQGPDNTRQLNQAPIESGTVNSQLDKVQAGAAASAEFSVMRIAGFESDITGDRIGPPILTPLQGQEITPARWKEISNRLWETYRAQGHLVRVDLILNKQDTGTVRITQLRVHALKVQATSGVDPEEVTRFERIAQNAIPAGSPVDLVQMEALIRRFYYRNDEIPRLDVQNHDPTSVDVTLTLQPPQTPATPSSWTVSADSYGLKDLGRTRLSAGLHLSPAGDGDVFSASGLVSAGLQAADVRYDLPAPYMMPLRFAVDYNYLDYHVQNTAPGLGEDGYAQTARLEASYPQFFWGGGMLTHTVSFDQVRAEDNVAGVNTAIKDMDNLRYRVLALNFAEDRASGWLELTYGHLSLGGLDAQADGATAQTQGQYSKAYAEGRWHQPFNDLIWLDTRLRGQAASKNLDSLEQFTLGGITGVRAYDADQARGAQGVQASLDLWAKPATSLPLRVGLFTDWGEVQNQVNTWQGASIPNSYNLNGAGTEVAYDYQALSLLFTAAHSLTQSNVVQNVGWRLWAEATLHF